MATLAADLVVQIRGDSRGVTNAAKEAQGAVNNLGSFLSRAASNAVGWIAASTIIHGFSAAVSFAGEAVIGLNGFMEQNRVAFTRMTGSAEQATNLLQELYQFAAETPFEIEGIVETTRNFMAIGLQAQQVRPLLSAIADGVAYVGKGAPEIDRVRIALVQMANRGRVATQEMNQLNEAGLTGMWQILADHLNVSTAKLQEMVEKGLVPADEFFVAFINHAQSKWGGAAAEQALTFNGAVTTIRDNVKQFLADALGPLFEMLKTGTVEFAKFTKTEQFRTWSATIAAYIQVVMDAYGALWQTVATVYSGILEIVVSVGQAIYEALQYINPWASFSPSLVANVESGSQAIMASYGMLGERIPIEIGRAGEAVERFKELAGPELARAMREAQEETNKTISYLGREAVDAYNKAREEVERLSESLAELDRVIAEEEKVLKDLESGLKELSATADYHRERVRELGDEYKEAESKLKEFLNAPLAGQAAFESAMFDIESSAKSLELAIVNMKLGRGIEKAKEEVDRLKDALDEARDSLDYFTNVDIEGTAGYKDAIADAELNYAKAKKEYLQAQNVLAGMKESGLASDEQLDNQKKLVEFLEDQEKIAKRNLDIAKLNEDIDLGPYRREIEKIANKKPELSFGEIVEGINKSKQEITGYESQLEKAEQVLSRKEKSMARLEKSLAKLRLEAQKLELQRWLDTAKARKDLEAMVPKAKELTFEEAKKGIEEQLRKMSEIGTELDSEKNKLKEAEDAVKMQNNRIDEQREKVQALKDHYSDVKDQVASMSSFLKEALQTAKSFQQEAEKAAKAAGKSKADLGDRSFDISKLPTAGPPDLTKFALPPEVQENLKKAKENVEALKTSLASFNSEITKWKEWLVTKIKEAEAETKPYLNLIKSYLQSLVPSQDFTDSMNTWWNTFVEAMNNAWKWAKKFFDGFQDGFKVLTPLINEDVKAIIEMLSRVWSRIETVLKAVAYLFMEVARGIGSHGEEIGQAFGVMAGVVVFAITKFIRGLVWLVDTMTWLVENSDKALKVLGDLWNAAGDGINSTVAAITKFGQETFDYYYEQGKDNLSKFVDNVKGLWDGLVTGLTTLWNTYVGTHITALTNFINTMMGLERGFSDFKINLWNSLVNTIQTVSTTLINNLVGFFFTNPDSLYNKMKNAFEAIRDIVVGLLSSDEGLRGKALTAVAGIVESIIQFFIPGFQFSLFTKLGNALQDIINEVWKYISGSDVNSIKAAAVNGFKSVIDAVMNGPLKNVVDTLVAPFREAWRKIQELLGRIKSGKKEAEESGDGGGGGSPEGQASGGPVRRGVPYIVGEKGPELFVPNVNGTIIPNGGSGSIAASASGPGTMNIQIMLDKRVLAEAVAPVIVGDIRIRNGIRI